MLERVKEFIKDLFTFDNERYDLANDRLISEMFIGTTVKYEAMLSHATSIFLDEWIVEDIIRTGSPKENKGDLWGIKLRGVGHEYGIWVDAKEFFYFVKGVDE